MRQGRTFSDILGSCVGYQIRHRFVKHLSYPQETAKLSTAYSHPVDNAGGVADLISGSFVVLTRAFRRFPALSLGRVCALLGPVAQRSAQADDLTGVVGGVVGG